MARTVLSNYMVAHVWAQQEQEYARSSKGNFYFNKTAIYSYRDGYPVGNFVKTKKGETVVLIWSGSYSVTTSRHTSLAASAARHHTYFYVRDVMVHDAYHNGDLKTRHGANVLAMADTVLAEVARVRKASHNLNMLGVSHLLGNYGLRTRLARLRDYCKAFGIKEPKTTKPLDVDTIAREYDEARVAAAAKAEEKAAKLLAKLGSQEAVRAYHQRRALLSDVSKVKTRCRGRLFERMGCGDHVAYDDAREFEDVRGDLQRWHSLEPNDVTIAKYTLEFNELGDFYSEQVRREQARRDAEQQERVRRQREEHGAFNGWTSAEQVRYVQENSHRQTWLTVEQREQAWRTHRAYIRPCATSGTLLRLSPDRQTIQTSQSASFPAEHGIKAWRLLKIVLRKGQAWQRNGQEIRLGHFHIDSIDEHGTITAGCHKVDRSEVEHMARLLGLETIETLPLTPEA